MKSKKSILHWVGLALLILVPVVSAFAFTKYEFIKKK